MQGSVQRYLLGHENHPHGIRHPESNDNYSLSLNGRG